MPIKSTATSLPCGIVTNNDMIAMIRGQSALEDVMGGHCMLEVVGVI